MPSPCALPASANRAVLLQLNAIVIVHGRHIRENDFVADLQALHDFNGIHRGASQSDLDAHRLVAAGHQLEQPDGAVRFAVDRPANEDNVGQAFEFDGAFDAQVRPRASRWRSIERNVESPRGPYVGLRLAA